MVTKSLLQGYMSAVRNFSQHSCGRDICLDPDPNKDKKDWTTHQMIRYILNHKKKTKERERKILLQKSNKNCSTQLELLR